LAAVISRSARLAGLAAERATPVIVVAVLPTSAFLVSV